MFSDKLEPAAEGQIRAICNMQIFRDSKIRIMPDVHAGKGCTIGTTMTITGYVVPNMVGVDIGCGMLCVKLKEKRIDLPKLDSCIRQNVPSGFSVRGSLHRSHSRIDLEELKCYASIDTRRSKESLGTLGGGNHFIEIDKDDEGTLYLVIHTGSRNPGLRVAEHYQKAAYDALGGRKQTDVPYELAYLTGSGREAYLADMGVMQRFASLNREIIKEVILSGMKLHEEESFSTIHNYIDVPHKIIRKGAIAAYEGQKCLIPLNMAEGTLVCIGKGNEDYLCSAPHGAGRIMSRSQARKTVDMDDYQKSMEGIYSSCVCNATIDESPQAYKNAADIVDAIGNTVDIIDHLRPVYNFKAKG